MAELQTLTAAFSIAELALRTARQIRKINQAPKNARALAIEVAQLHCLAHRIDGVSQSLEGPLAYVFERQSSSEVEKIKDSIRTIKQSLDNCLLFLDEKLVPWANSTDTGRRRDFGKSVKHAWSASEIGTQRKIVRSHIDRLTLHLSILQNLKQDTVLQNQEAMMETLTALTRAIMHSSEDEQPPVADNALAEPEPDLEQEDHQNQSGEIFAEEDEKIAEVQAECLACRRLRSMIEDTPLIIAVKHGEAESVRSLIAAGADVSVRDSQKRTVLHLAADQVDYNTVLYLLENERASSREFIDAITGDGKTALMLVASQAQVDDSYAIAEMLIKRHCDVNKPDASEDARSALFWAIDGSKTENRKNFVDLLVRSDAEVAPVWATQRHNAEQYESVMKAKAQEDEANTKKKGEREGEEELGSPTPPKTTGRKGSILGGMRRRFSQ